jgi:hypothetical protein
MTMEKQGSKSKTTKGKTEATEQTGEVASEGAAEGTQVGIIVLAVMGGLLVLLIGLQMC